MVFPKSKRQKQENQLAVHCGALLKASGTQERICGLSGDDCWHLQEAITSKDAEVASLRSMLVEYEQKIRALELSNYSLSMHLRQATESGRGFDTGQRPPDVY